MVLHFLFHLLADMCLGFGDFQLLVDQDMYAFQPSQQVGCLQYLLLLLFGGGGEAGGKVRQVRWIIGVKMFQE